METTGTMGWPARNGASQYCEALPLSTTLPSQVRSRPLPPTPLCPRLTGWASADNHRTGTNGISRARLISAGTLWVLCLQSRLRTAVAAGQAASTAQLGSYSAHKHSRLTVSLSLSGRSVLSTTRSKEPSSAMSSTDEASGRGVKPESDQASLDTDTESGSSAPSRPKRCPCSCCGIVALLIPAILA